ncbi:hypothetical protein MRX96_026602 [Rhipicephalus microplus]
MGQTSRESSAACTNRYRFVLLPSMLPERTKQAPEQQLKLPVAVVDATEASRAQLAHPASTHSGGNHSVPTRPNTTPTCITSAHCAVLHSRLDGCESCTRGGPVAGTIVTARPRAELVI